ncbi:hypothetical protein AB0C76_20870 [Kitasatospora sp. NPDC048722]|uniref:hypothetical protein n=1 Tax=Kitasatospora sp. NPDC048722 TaxID=3155639 RepID=UPI00340CF4A7
MRSLRTSVAAGVLVPLALLAAACGPNDDKSGGTTATTAATSASAASTTAATGTKAPTAAKALTQDQLVKSLLTTADLKADAQRSSLGPTRPDHRLTAGKPACQPLLDLVDNGSAATPAPSATGVYYGPNGREFTFVQLTQLGAGQAAKALTAADSAVAGCASFTATGAGGAPVKVTFAKATAPAVGEATLALNATFTADDCAKVLCEARGYVVTHTGDVLTLVSDSALADPGLPEQALVKKQLDKVQAAAK